MAQGALVMVEAQDDRWEAVVKQVCEDCIKVQYVSGAEDKDEWIQVDSEQLCLPQNTASVSEVEKIDAGAAVGHQLLAPSLVLPSLLDLDDTIDD